MLHTIKDLPDFVEVKKYEVEAMREEVILCNSYYFEAGVSNLVCVYPLEMQSSELTTIVFYVLFSAL